MSERVRSLIADFVASFGSQPRAARAAGVSQPVVSEAVRTGRCGPKLAIGIETATERRILRSDLRPDIWPASRSDAGEPSAPPASPPAAGGAA